MSLIKQNKLNYIMKTIVTSIMFAIAFSSASFASNKQVDNFPKAVLLTNGTEKSFFNYIENKKSRFTKEEDWKTIVTGVTLYNEEPSKFLNMNEDQKLAFNSAVVRLTNKLGNRSEAASWKASMLYTATRMNFVWNLNWDNMTPAENTESLVVAPIDSMF